MTDDQTLSDILRRLDALEAGAATATPSPTSDDATFWALDELRRTAPEPGAVMLVGTVTTPDGAHAQWQEAATTDDLLALDWSELAESVSALAHPVRLRLVRLVLDGIGTVKELTDVEGMGSTGQVYHHLRHLTSAGWLRHHAGSYRVPPERVVPLLAIVQAAAR